MHVDNIFAVGLKSRCDVFRDELNRMVPVKSLGELRWYGGCHYTRERETGTLTISQKDPFNDWGRGRGCNKCVPVLGGNGTKMVPTGDIFDQPLGQMR